MHDELTVSTHNVKCRVQNIHSQGRDLKNANEGLKPMAMSSTRPYGEAEDLKGKLKYLCQKALWLILKDSLIRLEIWSWKPPVFTPKARRYNAQGESENHNPSEGNSIPGKCKD